MDRFSSAPRWVFAVIALLTAMIIGYFGWQSISGQPPEEGPRKKITPGMYDLRAEAAKKTASDGARAEKRDSKE